MKTRWLWFNNNNNNQLKQSNSSSMRKVIDTIDRMLESHPKDFDTCLNELRKMKDEFPFLVKTTNPVANRPQDYSAVQLRCVIEQHSVFLREAVHMLLDAMMRNHDWPDLFKEIQENINEEKGSETKNIPHPEIMRRGYQKDLGILTDNVVPSLITASFIKKMKEIFNNNDNAYSAGALLALEGTAIQEFHMVDAVLKEYAKKSKLDNILADKTLTNYHINGHKDFEIGHEAHLATAIRPYINEENIKNMVKGYSEVALTMNIWWIELETESWQLLAKDRLAPSVQEFNIEAVIHLSE